MIINEYIKSTQHIMCPLYLSSFDKVPDTGDIPSEWLMATIVPLYKNKGDKCDANNYRGITLLSCVGKLLTSILNDRLTKFSDTMNVISENQAGCRQGYSTLDLIFLLKSVIDLFGWKKRRIFCLFVNYKTAFDMVCREALWYKLVKQKVTGKILNVVKNMYSNITSCVMLNQEVSETRECSKGERQGENLSPLLFAFYVDDIEERLSEFNCNCIKFSVDVLDSYVKLFVLMCADDTVILSDSKEETTRALAALEVYCRVWKLEVNCSKTKIVVFSRGKVVTDNYSFKLGAENIEIVESYKYLGVLFNCNGRFR